MKRCFRNPRHAILMDDNTESDEVVRVIQSEQSDIKQMKISYDPRHVVSGYVALVTQWDPLRIDKLVPMAVFEYYIHLLKNPGCGRYAFLKGLEYIKKVYGYISNK